MMDDKAEKPGVPLPELGPRQVLQDLQNTLTKLIHCNITFLDPQGKKILEPSRCTPFCHDPCPDRDTKVFAEGTDCVFKSFESSMLSDTALHACRHKRDFFTIKLRFRDRVVAVVILGPFIMSEKKSLPLNAFAYDPDLEGVPQSSMPGEVDSSKSSVTAGASGLSSGSGLIHDFRVLSGEKLTEIENFTQCLFESLTVLSRAHISEINL